MPLFFVSEGVAVHLTPASVAAVLGRTDPARGGIDWLVAQSADEAGALAQSLAWDAVGETNAEAASRHSDHLVDLTTEVSEAERGLVEQILAAVEGAAS